MKTLKILLCFAVVTNFACNDLAKKEETKKKEKISAKLVNNPITAQKIKQNNLLPELSFENLEHNFGKINQGESVSHKFTFVNSGKGDLVISQAKGSCGCTVPQWPKGAVAPGESAEIEVTFNSAGKSGKQNKTITLVSNAIPNTTVLTIYAQILVLENNK
ncbi:MAG: DUF1573 domain-containing protein [Flavobacteriales bacterium]|nr:DUF1573 domain-containing protein [Flavobacteriales bacterium]